MNELGIDEAGRGSMLGPLTMAAVLVPKSHQKILRDWGAKDSKLFGSNQKAKDHRALLSEKIEEEFQHVIEVIPSEIVDQYVTGSSLNKLEQVTAISMIKQLPADRVILDGATLFRPLCNKHILAFNKADQTYISVCAASILAKHYRDKLFEELCHDFKNEYGIIRGGGYANSQTLQFVKWHQKNKGRLPEFYRTSYQWKAIRILVNQ